MLQVITDNDRRGAQVFALDLQRGLTAEGITVKTVALGPSNTQSLLPVDVIGSSHKNPSTMAHLVPYCRQARVVIGHGGSTLQIAGAAAHLARRPYIYRQISDFEFWAQTPARRLRTTAGFRLADTIMVLWEGQAKLLEREFGVPPERMQLAPNGVEVSRFPLPTDQQRAAARERFGISGDEPVGVYVGSLVPEKGVGVAMRAIRDAGMNLIVVGDGRDRGRLHRLADEIGRSVRMAGSLADPLPAYWAADFAVLMSRGGDSMPAMLIEAGLVGLPSVATPIDGIVDIVIHGETGALVPLDDEDQAALAFKAVVADRERLGANARAHCAERYGMKLVTQRWLDALTPHL